MGTEKTFGREIIKAALLITLWAVYIQLKAMLWDKTGMFAGAVWQFYCLVSANTSLGIAL